MLNYSLQMISYMAYVLRGSAAQFEQHGESLILTALRVMQDCPATAISPRRVSIVLFFWCSYGLMYLLRIL